MRPVLFAALSALAGCSFIDTQRGAQYLCQRDAGDPAAQCPGGWVCGYSGYCIDPASPRTYACAADGDCVGGWHCGLAHLCLDPADPQPYDCVSDHDCSGDWHCGPAGQCYELATATNVLCRPAGTEDGGSDCAPGWRCGLNGQCHDRDAGTDYQCANDLDCEQLWRCGPDGRCVDAHLDALRPNDTFGSPGSQLINPVLPTATPDLVASSNAHSLDSCGTSATLSSASLVSKGELTKWQRYAGFYNGLPVDCPDGGVFSAARTLSSEVIHVSLEGGSPVAVTDDGPDTWALMADGGLWRVSYDFRTRLSAQQPIPPPFAPVGLKAIESSRGALLVFDSQRVAVLRMGGTWDLTPPVPQALDGGGALIDVAMATVNGTEVVFAGSRLGLHSLANPGGSLVLGTWALPWRDCKAQVAVTNLQVVAGSTNLNSPMSYLAAQTVDTVSRGGRVG